MRLTRARSVIFVFHAPEAPEQPLPVLAPEIDYDQGCRGRADVVTDLRIYPKSGTHDYVISAAEYAPVLIERVKTHRDRERVVPVFFERKA